MRHCIFFILSILLVSPLFAQNDGESGTITNGQLWNELNFTHALKRVVLQTDLEANRCNDSTNQLNITKHFLNIAVRGWVHYYVTPRVKLTAGLEYLNTQNTPEVNQLPSVEIRQVFQAQHIIARKRMTVYNRLRFDNRFIDNGSPQHYDYAARLRYMPKVVVALNSVVVRRKTVYAIASDEIFMSFGYAPLFNINRATIGIGYCFTDNVILELCYHNQRKTITNAPTEITNALGVTLSINNFIAMLKKKKK